MIEPVRVAVQPGDSALLTWNRVAGRTHTVEPKDAINAANWTTRCNLPAAGLSTTMDETTVIPSRLATGTPGGIKSSARACAVQFVSTTKSPPATR